MFENLKDAIRSDAPPTPSRSVFLQQARVDSTLFGFFIDCRQLDIKRRIAVVGEGIPVPPAIVDALRPVLAGCVVVNPRSLRGEFKKFYVSHVFSIGGVQV